MQSPGPYAALLPLPVDTWSHVAWVYQEGTLTYYLNGVEARTWMGLVGSIEGNSGSQLWLGGRNDKTDRYFRGSLDEVRMYNGALTSGQIGVLGTEKADAGPCTPASRNSVAPENPSLEIEPSVSIYPNPNEGAFNVVWNQVPQGPVSVKLINTLGKVVYARQIAVMQGNVLEVSLDQPQPSGMYYLSLESENASFLKTVVLE